jgi:hypothetical protein
MRWRSFNRLLEKANDLARLADVIFAFRVMRLFGKTPEELYDD